MKTFLSILGCFFLSNTFSQNIFLVSVSTIQEGYGNIVSGIEVKDGFIGTGYSEPFTSNDPVITLYKIDFHGQLVWAKKINSINIKYNSGYGTAIVKTHDGGFAITATVGSDYPINGLMCLLKFDANGLMQWTKQYDEGSGSASGGLLQTDDNDFLIEGSYGYSSSSGYLIKTDSAGNLKWSKKFIGVNAVYGLQQTTNHNYILLGVNSDNSTSVIKIDTDGNILWTKTFNDSLNYGLYANSILSAADGSYLITGPSIYLYRFVIKLDSNGNPLWSKLVSIEGELSCAIETRTRDFVLTGRRIDENNNYNYYLIKIDNSGALIWIKTFPHADMGAGITNLITTADGGYLAVGASGYENGNGVFIKFDSEFNICVPTQSIGSLQGLKVSYKNKTISTVAGKGITYTIGVVFSSGGSSANICSALPVNLLAFNAKLQNKAVQIHWQTATEVNTSYFNIQRSTDGINFANIGKVNATGNSTSLRSYTYSDMNGIGTTNTKILYYRLQTVDKDGTVTLSKTVPIIINDGIIDLVIYPNPVREKLSARIMNYSGKADIRVCDIMGKQLYHNTATINNADININTSLLMAGTYLLEINASGCVLRQKFVKE